MILPGAMISDSALLSASGLSVTLAYLCIHVLARWGNAALNVVKQVITGPSKYLILGVWVGIVSVLVDGLYWVLPWALNFFGMEDTAARIMFGVYQSLPIKYGLAIFAVYMYLKSSVAFSKDRRTTRPDLILLNATAMGVLTTLVLYFTKTGG